MSSSPLCLEMLWCWLSDDRIITAVELGQLILCMHSGTECENYDITVLLAQSVESISLVRDSCTCISDARWWLPHSCLFDSTVSSAPSSQEKANERPFVRQSLLCLHWKSTARPNCARTLRLWVCDKGTRSCLYAPQATVKVSHVITIVSKKQCVKGIEPTAEVGVTWADYLWEPNGSTELKGSPHSTHHDRCYQPMAFCCRGIPHKPDNRGNNSLSLLFFL